MLAIIQFTLISHAAKGLNTADPGVEGGAREAPRPITFIFMEFSTKIFVNL